MKKKIFAVLLTLCVILAAAMPAAATEADTLAANQCGDNLTWEFADGVLTITGEGPMYDYLEGGPWSDYIDEIRKVVFAGGVTYIGAYAFRDYDALEEVDFGDAMYEIGMEAFRSCDGLTEIHLPETFKIFGESSFESCENLTEIHSAGRFPSFRENSMWQTYATIYFPAEKPWDVELIKELEEAFHGRIQFLASDGSDPYDPNAETTVPETEAPTTAAPTTEAPTEPETTAAPVTEPETTAAPTQITEPETQETSGGVTEPLVIMSAEEEKSGPNGIVIGGSIVGGIFLLAIVGKLIFGKKKGKYSR